MTIHIFQSLISAIRSICSDVICDYSQKTDGISLDRQHSVFDQLSTVTTEKSIHIEFVKYQLSLLFRIVFLNG